LPAMRLPPWCWGIRFVRVWIGKKDTGPISMERFWAFSEVLLCVPLSVVFRLRCPGSKSSDLLKRLLLLLSRFIMYNKNTSTGFQFILFPDLSRYNYLSYFPSPVCPPEEFYGHTLLQHTAHASLISS